MGTSEFQQHYIEYLEQCNAKLHDELIKRKETEHRLLNKSLWKNDCQSALKEITNVCDSACDAIDTLFENLTNTMNSLRAVLVWKARISQLPKKLAHSLNMDDSSGADLTSFSEFLEAKNGKKCGTAKVSPMIKGHVISTPRIQLNRVNEDTGSQSNHSLPALSPIVETSPVQHESPVYRDIRIPLQRVQIGRYSRNGEVSDLSRSMNESTAFKLMRTASDLSRKRAFSAIPENDSLKTEKKKEKGDSEVICASKTSNEECDLNEKDKGSAEVGKNGLGDVVNDADPLEGPSWLLDATQDKGRQISSGISSFHNFVNYKRPNYSIPIFSRNEEKENVANTSGLKDEELEDENDHSDRHGKQARDESDVDFVHDEVFSEHSHLYSPTEGPKREDDNKSDITDYSIEEELMKLSPVQSPRSISGRKSNDNLENNEVQSTRKSNIRSRTPIIEGLRSRRSVSGERKSSFTSFESKPCMVKLEPVSEPYFKNNGTPKSCRVDENRASNIGRKSSAGSGNSTNNETLRRSIKSNLSDNSLGKHGRSTRRAALKCLEKKNWIELTPKSLKKKLRKKN